MKPRFCNICALMLPLVYLVFWVSDQYHASMTALVWLVLAYIAFIKMAHIYVRIINHLLLFGIYALSMMAGYQDAALASGIAMQSAYHTWYVCRYAHCITEAVVNKALNIAIVMLVVVCIRRSLYYNVSVECGIYGSYIVPNDGYNVIILAYRLSIILLHTFMFSIVTDTLRRNTPSMNISKDLKL